MPSSFDFLVEPGLGIAFRDRASVLWNLPVPVNVLLRGPSHFARCQPDSGEMPEIPGGRDPSDLDSTRPLGAFSSKRDDLLETGCIRHSPCALGSGTSTVGSVRCSCVEVRATDQEEISTSDWNDRAYSFPALDHQAG